MIHLDKIKNLAKGMGDVTIMEICGGHTNVIMKYGIRDILPENIKLISGPGCPVCVSSQYDIDCMLTLAKNGIPIATYGDMMNVPGSFETLEDMRAKGGQIHEIYSTTEVLKLKERFPDIVFFGVGFETTAPMTAFLLENSITVYSVHKLVPPAIKALISDMKIDGFIDPGHVSTIIGVKAYTDIKVPQVISGFSSEMILRSIRVLLEMIRDGRDDVINGYPEAVSDQGNQKAQALLDKHFKIADSEWRGLGALPRSGLEVKENQLNARIKYSDLIKGVKRPKQSACRCGDVLRGLIEPNECSLYRNKCTPELPMGACMVSAEGSCSISYRYGR